MWVEGQDIDCENAASGSFLTYKLGLTLDNDEQILIIKTTLKKVLFFYAEICRKMLFLFR